MHLHWLFCGLSVGPGKVPVGREEHFSSSVTLNGCKQYILTQEMIVQSALKKELYDEEIQKSQ